MAETGNALELSLAAALRGLANEATGSEGPKRLAVEFDNRYTAYVDHLQRLPTDAQLQSLQALDSALNSIFNPSSGELWSEAAFQHHPRWVEIRELARAALAEFGWAPARLN